MIFHLSQPERCPNTTYKNVNPNKLAVPHNMCHPTLCFWFSVSLPATAETLLPGFNVAGNSFFPLPTTMGQVCTNPAGRQRRFTAPPSPKISGSSFTFSCCSRFSQTHRCVLHLSLDSVPSSLSHMRTTPTIPMFLSCTPPYSPVSLPSVSHTVSVTHSHIHIYIISTISGILISSSHRRQAN